MMFASPVVTSAVVMSLGPAKSPHDRANDYLRSYFKNQARR